MTRYALAHRLQNVFKNKEMLSKHQRYIHYWLVLQSPQILLLSIEFPHIMWPQNFQQVC